MSYSPVIICFIKKEDKIPSNLILYESAERNIPFSLGQSQKNRSFLVAQPLRPYPPPLELSGHKTNSRIFFLKLQKQRYFFLMAKPLPPATPLSGRATKKRPIFCGFPYKLKKNHFLQIKQYDYLYLGHLYC